MKPFRVRDAAVLGACILTVSAGAGLAQVPDKFTNLQVFPKDVGKEELVGTMREFSDALGVRCTFCHQEKVPGDHSSIDWASDSLDPKKIARGMMKMAGAINTDLLPAATGEHDVQVSCVTCHRGLSDPATLDQVMLKTAGKDGIDAAIAKYRELRGKYYGSGSYDFGPETLGKVAETLAQDQGNLPGAAKFIDLNLEMNPQDADVYVMKAQLQLAGGDKTGAKASAQKALELDPQNRQADRMLKQLNQGQ
jgi:hypothetical protein